MDLEKLLEARHVFNSGRWWMGVFFRGVCIAYRPASTLSESAIQYTVEDIDPLIRDLILASAEPVQT